MLRFVFFIIFLLISFSQTVIAVTDVSLHSGNATGKYSESTDSQSKELSGSDTSLSIRNLNTFSFVDVGLDLGVLLKSPAGLELSGDTGTHDVNFLSNYANLTAGFSFSLYPSWIEYYLDLGYRVGIGRLEVLRTESDGSKDQYTYNAYVNDSIIKYGIKLVVLNRFIIGMNQETKNLLFQKSSAVLNPKIDSANSLTISIGYRFGGKSETSPSKVESGKSNYNDPCLLFRGAACN